MSQQAVPESMIAYEALIEASLVEILRHEDAGRYLDWMRANARIFLGEVPVIDEDQRAALAIALGRGIWNAVPLPGNQFRPRPMPEPGRNDSCPCGSGRKYKHCCAGVPQLQDLTSDEIWPVLLDHLTEPQLEQAARSHRLPPHVLAHLAMHMVEDGAAERAMQLLEPLFAGPLGRRDDRLEPALDVLCEAYLALGCERERWALLERVAAQATGPLRRAAWQRIAVMARDQGDIPKAWEAFRKAQQADPGDPSLALSEILLLMTEQRVDEASARARFWAARLRKEGYPDEELIDHLEALARDPAKAMADMFSQSLGIDLAPVRAWVARVASRPLPEYRLESPPVLDPSDKQGVERMVREHFTALGLPPEDLDMLTRKASRELVKQARKAQREARAAGADALRQPELEPGPGEDDAPAPLEAGRLLRAPEGLTQLEAAWHNVFPCGKPIGTQRELGENDDPWLEEDVHDWLAFLDRRPEAADSLDILDDLVTALLPVEQGFPGGTQGGLALQLAQRGRRIVEAAVAAEPCELHWAVPQNRPGLRLIARCVDGCLDLGEVAQAVALVERLLQLNPHDNHGFRGILLAHRLRVGESDAAQALLDKYPDDAGAEMRYGEVLLRLKQGDVEAARSALTAAYRCNAHVPAMLAGEHAQAPQDDDGWIAWGSPEEAWEYRELARDVWAAAPGALEWLSDAARALPKPPAPEKRREKQRKQRS